MGVACFLALRFDHSLKLESYLEIEGCSDSVTKIRRLETPDSVFIYSAHKILGLVEIVKNASGGVELREIKQIRGIHAGKVNDFVVKDNF